MQRLAKPRLYALVFGAVGYALVVWASLGFAPLPVEVALILQFSCLICFNVNGTHTGRVLTAFELFGPINALVYAVVGFLIGKLMLRIRK